jgi:hypothetical protein
MLICGWVAILVGLILRAIMTMEAGAQIVSP